MISFATESVRPWPVPPKVLAPAALAAAYFLGSMVGLSLQFPSTQISAIWPPNAILLAALLITPRARWWICLLAVLPVHLLAQMLMGIPIPVVLINFAGNVGDAVLGALAIDLFLKEPRRFDRLRAVVLIMLFGGIVAPAIMSFVVAELFVGLGLSTHPWLEWRLRLLTNALAVFTLVPPLVLAFTKPRSPAKAVKLRRSGEAGALLTGLVVIGILVFGLPRAGAGPSPILLYIPLPFLLWAAMRFGPTGVSLSVLALGALSMWGVIHGYGPFAEQRPVENATSLVLFLTFTSAPLLMLAALLEEHKSMGRERQQSEVETRQQRRELAHLTRVAMLGELSGALAHELNQPLTAILSNAQAAQRMLAREPVDLEELREILHDIADDDRRAGDVIQRLRAMLKKEETKLAPLDLNELVQEVLSLEHSDLITRNVSVILQLAPVPPVRGDRVQLQQVLLNLILNACEAMACNQPSDRELTVVTTRDEERSVWAIVTDRGTGIPADEIERVFEPFFTTKAHGLGLGLPICRSIVAAHGGRLWASNNEDRGATFHLTLPVDDERPV